MNFKIAAFTLSLLSSLILQDAFAGHIDDFTPEEQQLIKKFYIVATEFDSTTYCNKQTVLEKAKELIETAPKVIPNYGKTNFSIADLFTTTCDIEAVVYDNPKKKTGANYLLDYFGNMTDSAFFNYILQYIQNINNVKDNKGRTSLMRLANALSHSGEGNSDKDTLDCFSLLLKKGASPTLQDNEGRNALTIALFANNTPMVDRIMEHLKQHDIPLSKCNSTLLAIRQGEFIALDSPEEPLLRDMYRVANQSKNYKMVNFLYKFFDRDELFNTLKPAYYFHPPLWAYNISQMKEYAISRVRELQKNIINESKVIPAKNDLFEYHDGTQKLLLKKKAAWNVGRILGRNHLERIIQQVGAQDKLAVPQKFLTVPSGDLQHIEVILTIPTGSTDWGLYMDKERDNSVKMEIKGAIVYAEFIAGKSSRSLVANDPTVRKVGDIAGFEDYGPGDQNFVFSAQNNKIYFIDTDDCKNFTSKWTNGVPDTVAAIKSYAAMKSYCFDPRIKYISLQLSPEDFH